MSDYLTNDPHAAYVLSAYLGTALIVGVLIWVTLRANARARDELENAERERKQ